MRDERTPHDAAYKHFFSNPEMVESLLRDFVAEDFIVDLDFSTLEHCASSYVADDLRERHDDSVWRVRWKDTWCYLYLILEFQSTPDPWMAVRILAYTALLWQDLIKSGTVREGEPLPPVFPMVIYNGGKIWTAPQEVEALLAPLTGRLSAYQPRQRYFLLDEKRVSEDVLDKSGGLAGELLRLERVQTLDDVRPIIKNLLDRLRAPEYLHLRRAFAVWLGRVVLKHSGIIREVPEFQDLQEVDAMLEERAAQWKNEYIQQGLIRGRIEGIEIGEARGKAIGEERGKVIGEAKGIGLALQDFLQARFGSVPLSVSSYIAETCDVGTLRKLTLSAYHAESLQTFIEAFNQINLK